MTAQHKRLARALMKERPGMSYRTALRLVDKERLARRRDALIEKGLPWQTIGELWVMTEVLDGEWHDGDSFDEMVPASVLDQMCVAGWRREGDDVGGNSCSIVEGALDLAQNGLIGSMVVHRRSNRGPGGCASVRIELESDTFEGRVDVLNRVVAYYDELKRRYGDWKKQDQTRYLRRELLHSVQSVLRRAKEFPEFVGADGDVDITSLLDAAKQLNGEGSDD